jgi:hypothetical protein
MDIFIIKLLLTPLLIAALTLIGRRWGPAASGAIAGLPLTSGPVSLFLALEQGKTFATQAALATLAGLIAVAVFCFAYWFVAPRANWIASTVVGIAVFLVAVSVLLFAPSRLLPTFIVVVAFIALIFFNMPSTAKYSDNDSVALPHPKWDLPLRMAIATALVFVLTTLARKLGPQLTGVLSPFPVFGSVLTAFAHRQLGVKNARRVLRGVVLGSFAFAVFFLCVGAMLVHYGCIFTYSMASLGALIANAILFRLLRAKL